MIKIKSGEYNIDTMIPVAYDIATHNVSHVEIINHPIAPSPLPQPEIPAEIRKGIQDRLNFEIQVKVHQNICKKYNL